MSLEDIRVVVDAGESSPYRADALSGNAPVLLRELAEHVRQLVAAGESTAIDLNALPLTPADLDWLKATLGEGEISVTLHSDGESTLAETACERPCRVPLHRGRLRARAGQGAPGRCKNRIRIS